MSSLRPFHVGDRVVRLATHMDVPDRPLVRPIGVVVCTADIDGNVAVRWSICESASLVRSDDLELVPVVVCPEVNSSRSPMRNGKK